RGGRAGGAGGCPSAGAIASERQERPDVEVGAVVAVAVVRVGMHIANLSQQRQILGQRVVDAAGDLAVLGHQGGRVAGVGEVELAFPVVDTELHGSNRVGRLDQDTARVAQVTHAV